MIDACHAPASCRSWQPSCSSWRARPTRVPASTRSLRPHGSCGLPRRLDESHHGPRRRGAGGLVAGPLGVDSAAGHDDRRGRSGLPHAHAALPVLRPREDAGLDRLGRRADAGGRAADGRADPSRRRPRERLPPGRGVALRSSGGRRRSDRSLGRLRDARAAGRDGRGLHCTGPGLGRRRWPDRRGLASQRRVRDRRDRRSRVRRRRCLAGERRQFVDVDPPRPVRSTSQASRAPSPGCACLPRPSATVRTRGLWAVST